MRVLQRIVRGAEDATGLFPTFCPRSEKVQKKDSEHCSILIKPSILIFSHWSRNIKVKSTTLLR